MTTSSCASPSGRTRSAAAARRATRPSLPSLHIWPPATHILLAQPRGCGARAPRSAAAVGTRISRAACFLRRESRAAPRARTSIAPYITAPPAPAPALPLTLHLRWRCSRASLHRCTACLRALRLSRVRLQVNTRPPPTFFPLDEKMAFIPAAILGFQHMIAMLIGAKLQRCCARGQLSCEISTRTGAATAALTCDAQASSPRPPSWPTTPTTRRRSCT